MRTQSIMRRIKISAVTELDTYIFIMNNNDPHLHGGVNRPMTPWDIMTIIKIHAAPTSP